jgi:hypothetical protein
MTVTMTVIVTVTVTVTCISANHASHQPTRSPTCWHPRQAHPQQRRIFLLINISHLLNVFSDWLNKDSVSVSVSETL